MYPDQKFIMIVAPTNSGSSVLNQLIGQHDFVGWLQGHEGFNLVQDTDPECVPFDKPEPNHRLLGEYDLNLKTNLFDFGSYVRSLYKHFNEKNEGRVRMCNYPVLVEKSPMNIYIADEVLNRIPCEKHVIFLDRNPIALTEGFMRRTGVSLFRAMHNVAQILKDMEHMWEKLLSGCFPKARLYPYRYEEMCEGKVLDELDLIDDRFNTNPVNDPKFRSQSIDGTKVQGFKNYNKSQIENLNQSQYKEILSFMIKHGVCNADTRRCRVSSGRENCTVS